MNGDGYGDVIVGADLYDGGLTDEGKVSVYCGSPYGLNLVAGWTKEGDQAGAEFGFSVASAGDVNHDGYGDILVGAPYYDYNFVNGQPLYPDQGAVFVYYGGPNFCSGISPRTQVFAVEQKGIHLGWSVSTAGDVNGDGYSDILVGAPDLPAPDQPGMFKGVGKAYLTLGGSSGLGALGSWSMVGEYSSSTCLYAMLALWCGGFGDKVAAAGDVNHDGYGDFLVSAPFYTAGSGLANAGKVYLFLGPSPGSSVWSAVGDQGNAWFGRAIASAGDVNNDTYSDIVIGHYGYSNGQLNEGRVVVYYGGYGDTRLLPPTPNWAWEGNQKEGYFGYSVASADVNYDGFGDIIVGAPWYDFYFDYSTGAPLYPDEGGAFVFLGSAGGLQGSFAWSKSSNQAGAHFGLSVASAGDVRRDKYPDLVIGGPGFENDKKQVDEGWAWLFEASSSTGGGGGGGGGRPPRR